MKPSETSIGNDFILTKGEKIQHLTFWEYYVGVTSFDSSLDSNWLFNISPTVATLLAIKEFNKLNCPVDGKILLLACLYAKMLDGKIKYGEDAFVIVSLLCYYYPLITSSGDSFLDIYFGVLLEIIKNYGMMRKSIQPQLNNLIMKVI